MFEKEKVNQEYLKMGENLESKAAAPQELEKILTPLKETLATALQIVAKDSMAASDSETLTNHPDLIALRPKETSRRNSVGILYYGAEDLITQLEYLARYNEDQLLLLPAEKLLTDIKAANPLHQTETRLKVMERLLPEVSLRDTAFQQLTNPNLNGPDKYTSLFILRPFNLTDNIITDLDKIVNHYPNNLKLPSNNNTPTT